MKVNLKCETGVDVQNLQKKIKNDLANLRSR